MKQFKVKWNSPDSVSTREQGSYYTYTRSQGHYLSIAVLLFAIWQYIFLYNKLYSEVKKNNIQQFFFLNCSKDTGK